MCPFDILASLAMDIYLPVVPTMPSVLNTSHTVVQLTLSLYMLILGAGQVIFGPISDRLGRRPVLLGGALLFAVSSVAMAFTTYAPLFIGFRIAQGIGASAALVATFTTVRDVYANRPEATTIYALFGSILSFVPALGPIAGSLIAKSFGWRAIFLALGGLAAISGLRAHSAWEETRVEYARTDSVSRAFAAILRNVRFWTFTLGSSTAFGSFYVFFSISPRLLIDRAGYSELEFSLAFSSVALVMIAMSRLVPKIVTKLGTTGCLITGMIVLMAGATFTAFGSMTSPSFVTLILPMWLVAIGIVTTGAVTANGALQDFDHAAGTAVALYFCIESLIVSVIGTLVVEVFNGSTVWPLVIFSTTMPIMTLAVLAWNRGHFTERPTVTAPTD